MLIADDLFDAVRQLQLHVISKTIHIAGMPLDWWMFNGELHYEVRHDAYASPAALPKSVTCGFGTSKNMLTERAYSWFVSLNTATGVTARAHIAFRVILSKRHNRLHTRIGADR
jgi:hypothetical protein